MDEEQRLAYEKRLLAVTLRDKQVLAATRAYVRARLEHESSGHDWWHIERVARMARRLAREERANGFLCELAALLHDLVDWKVNPDEAQAQQDVRAWLEEQRVSSLISAAVMGIITHMSFKGGGQPPLVILEGQIVQDADRLDAIGAIGIGRAFAYGGTKGRPMHDPDVPPRSQMTVEEYRHQQTPTINHFYEKLLLLKDQMNTATAKRLAEQRHAVLLAFLDEFQAEWDGER